MENPQLPYIEKCKGLIEEQLAWPGESKDWKQRDYMNLISILEGKTGVSLSLSTVKRIWREGYQGTPHPTTLDVFAQFLEYENWLQFQESQQHKIGPPSPRQAAAGTRHLKVNKYLLSLLIVLLGLAGFWVLSKSMKGNPNQSGSTSKAVSFSASNSQANGVPNTVIFSYSLMDVEADSFFIQQSWNPLNKEKIKQTDSVLTSIYYYPGVHTAKLIANDAVIQETQVRVNSGGWMATTDYGMRDRIPSYVKLKVENGRPQLHIDKDDLSDYDIEINEDIHVSYFYVDTLAKVSGDNFVLTVNLKGDSILNLTCPAIRIMIFGSTETHSMSLVDKGCTNKAYVKFGERMISGRNSDLRGLGVPVYEEQELVIQVREKQSSIYLNGQVILEAAYTESIGELTGFHISFTGTGEVNSLKLHKEPDGPLIFEY